MAITPGDRVPVAGGYDNAALPQLLCDGRNQRAWSEQGLTPGPGCG
jgi:hypothetical protein